MSSRLKLRVWVVPGSFHYWKVVDVEGDALMTALSSESCAAHWANNKHARPDLELQTNPWPTPGQKKEYRNPMPSAALPSIE